MLAECYSQKAKGPQAPLQTREGVGVQHRAPQREEEEAGLLSGRTPAMRESPQHLPPGVTKVAKVRAL